MKKVMNVVEVENEGLMALIGEGMWWFFLYGVTFMPENFTGVNEECIF